jgi:hypothetical protein
MSEQHWAAIVYGRSYHLDFRFITIPYDFTAQEIAWVSPYIFATTQKARNLADSPRWSLFKNESHCVVGVTCMVRDLIGTLAKDLIEVMGKDDLGRPLYVFVGYVTKLNASKSIVSLPAYTENNLVSFQPLHQEIEKVWLLRDYDNKKPLLSEYQPFNHAIETATISTHADKISQLNDQTKQPDHAFIYQTSTSTNSQFWVESAQCIASTSVCLNVRGKYLLNSPFLNQTATNLAKNEVRESIVPTEKNESYLAQSTEEKSSENSNFSLKQKISTRAKEDLDLTLQQAAKITSASQDMINHLTDWSNSNQKTIQPSELSKKSKDNFGFKHKNEPISAEKDDWF